MSDKKISAFTVLLDDGFHLEAAMGIMLKTVCLKGVVSVNADVDSIKDFIDAQRVRAKRSAEENE